MTPITQLSELVLDLPLQALLTSPLNPRKETHDDTLAELAASIVEVGLIGYPVVRRAGDQFEIVAGARRVRAAKLAGLHTIPCVVRQLSDVALIEHALVENHQRQRVHALDEADAMAQLMGLDAAYTPGRLASRLGVSVSWVYGRLRLRLMIAPVQAAFRAGALTLEHADELAKLDVAQQPAALSICFGELLLGSSVTLAVAQGRWDDLARALLSPAELKRWIAHHRTVDIRDADVQAAIPGLTDALEEAAADRARLLQVSEVEGLTSSEARTLGVIRRERWIEILVEGGHAGPYATRRRCESMQTVVVTHPADRPARPVQGCIKPSCPVHRPTAANDPVVLARRAQDKAWRAQRPAYFKALAKRVQSIVVTPALVRACLPQTARDRLSSTFGVTITKRTAAQALVLSAVPAEASKDDPRLLAVTKALGLTPEQWERKRCRKP